MKKYIISLVMLLWSHTAFAGQTNIINAGSDSGAFHQVLTMIGNKVDHKFVQAGNPIIASKHFEKSYVLHTKHIKVNKFLLYKILDLYFSYKFIFQIKIHI